MINLIKLITHAFAGSPAEIPVRKSIRKIDKKYPSDLNFENRASSRINRKATVMIETRNGNDFCYATMYNFSGDGMYCGSDFSIKPGTAITIRFDHQPYISAPKIYIGEIRRCEELNGAGNSHTYGLGIKILKAMYE